MREFDALAMEIARAAVAAELEYIRWTGDESLVQGRELLLTTSVARAVSAFYGIRGSYRVYLEEPISEIAKSFDVTPPSSGRIDCAVYHRDVPHALIECKARFYQADIARDVNRIVDLLRSANGRLKRAFIVGLRGVHEHDRKSRMDSALSIAENFKDIYPDCRFKLTSNEQDLVSPIDYDEAGVSRLWKKAFAGCLAVSLR